jgi:tetratricopeptide (TPR) repeat protein
VKIHLLAQAATRRGNSGGRNVAAGASPWNAKPIGAEPKTQNPEPGTRNCEPETRNLLSILTFHYIHIPEHNSLMGSKRRKGRKSKEANAGRVSQPAQVPRHHIWLVCIAISVATFAIYAQVLQFQFVDWDDPMYVYDNPHIAQGLTPASVRWAFSSGYASNWHPLTWISHMVDVELFGLQHPGGHHLVSVLLHVANSLLLLWLLTRMTGAFWPSALTVALFAVHPLRVESVAWVSERKDVLSGLFFMLTLLAYHGYTQRPTLRRYLLVFIALALGLMSKPMLVTVPFLLLLLDLWPLRRWELPAWPPRRIVLDKLPLVGLVVASSWITVLVQKAGGSVVEAGVLSWGWRFVNAPVAYVMYALKTLCPTQLAFMYPHPANISGESFGTWVLLAIGASLPLALASVCVMRTVRRRPYFLVGWLWFLGMLLPVVGLIQVGNQAWADRYAYLPLVGLYLMFSWSVLRMIEVRPALRQAVIVALVVMFLILSVLSWRQVGVWRDNESLYVHALAVTKNNFVAHDMLGNVLRRSGRYQEAIGQFQQSLQIKQDYSRAGISLGAALQETGRANEALALYEHVLSFHPNSIDARNNLGLALNAVGRSQEAIRQFQEILRLKPDNGEAHYNLGFVLHGAGDIEQAAGYYQKALQLNPDHIKAHTNLAAILAGQGRHREAFWHYEQALRIKPDHVEAHNNWGVALANLGRPDEAARHYQQALRMNPDYAEAHNNLGLVYAGKGQLAEALKHFEHAVRLNPNYVDARENVRRFRAQLGGMVDGDG